MEVVRCHLKNRLRLSSLKRSRPVLFALLAAGLFALNAPLSKLLLGSIDPLFLAALLYLGAGAGMLAVWRLRRAGSTQNRESGLTRKELPYIALMILLDIAAPITLLYGLRLTNAGTAALLGNFEIVATTIFALLLFREAVGRRLWLAIGLILCASLLLSFEDISALRLSAGALLVLLACACWGLENNCTRMLSIKDPLQVVVIKGFGSGLGALLVASIWGSLRAPFWAIFAGLALGLVAYGLSIFFYVRAQRDLGASRTSVYYAAAPFIGVLFSWLILGEKVNPVFLLALGVMLLGALLAVTEQHRHPHLHKALTHEHRHSHDDGHHAHAEIFSGEHSHAHTHQALDHEHHHHPDAHHRHGHG